jgi:hypothetical protein
LGVVFSAAESVATPGTALFSVLVEEQPEITKVRAAASANRVCVFKAILPWSVCEATGAQKRMKRIVCHLVRIVAITEVWKRFYLDRSP